MTPDASCIPVLSAQLIIPNRTSVASNTVGLRLPQDRPSPFTRVDTLLRQPRGFRWRGFTATRTIHLERSEGGWSNGVSNWLVAFCGDAHDRSPRPVTDRWFQFSRVGIVPPPRAAGDRLVVRAARQVGGPGIPDRGWTPYRHVRPQAERVGSQG